MRLRKYIVVTVISCAALLLLWVVNRQGLADGDAPPATLEPGARVPLSDAEPRPVPVPLDSGSRDANSTFTTVRSRLLGAPLVECNVVSTSSSGRPVVVRTDEFGALALTAEGAFEERELAARVESEGAAEFPLVKLTGTVSHGQTSSLACDVVSALVDSKAWGAVEIRAAFFSPSIGLVPTEVLSVVERDGSPAIVRLDETALPRRVVEGDMRLFLRLKSSDPCRVGFAEFDLQQLRSLDPAVVAWMSTGSVTVEAGECLDFQTATSDPASEGPRQLSLGFEGRLVERSEPLPPSVLRWFLMGQADSESDRQSGRWSFPCFPAGIGWECVVRVPGYGRFTREFRVVPGEASVVSFCGADTEQSAYVVICKEPIGANVGDKRWREYWSAWSADPPLEFLSYDAGGDLVGVRVLGRASGPQALPDELGRWKVAVADIGPTRLVIREWRSPRTRMDPAVFEDVRANDTVETCPYPYPGGQYCIVYVSSKQDPFEIAEGPLDLFLISVVNQRGSCADGSVRINAFRIESEDELKRGLVVPADGLLAWCVTAPGTRGASGPASMSWGTAATASDAYFGTLRIEVELEPGHGNLAVARLVSASAAGDDSLRSGAELVTSWFKEMPVDLVLPRGEDIERIDLETEGRAMMLSAEWRRESIPWCGARDTRFVIAGEELPQVELAPGVVFVRGGETTDAGDCSAVMRGFRAVPVQRTSESGVWSAKFDVD